MSDIERKDSLTTRDKSNKLATLTNDDLYPIMDGAVEFIIKRLSHKYEASKFACRHFHDSNRFEVAIDYLMGGKMGTFQYSIDLKRLKRISPAFFEGQLDIMIDKHFQTHERKQLHGKEIEE